MILLKLFKKLKSYTKEILIVIITLFLNVIGVLTLPRLTVGLIDVGVATGDFNYIFRQGGMMILIALLSSLMMVISAYYSTYVATGFSADTRDQVFRKVENISITQYEKIGASSLITRSTDDIAQVQQLVQMGLRMMLRAPLMFIGGIIMAMNTNMRLTVVFLIALPIVTVVITIFGSRIFPLMVVLRKALDNINKVFRERLSGIRVIRAFHREVYEENEFRNVNNEYIKVFKKSSELAAFFMPVIMLIMNLVLVGIIYYGSKLMMIGQMEVGQMVGYIQYANNIMHSFMMLSMIFIQIPRSKASIERLTEVLELPNDDVEEGGVKLDKIETVEFKDVCFRYKDAPINAIEDINFKVSKGETLGIIGGTGSGKSTIANLLVRFYETTRGEILVNGQNMEVYDITSLRANIGYVEQKANLISGTISSNVAMGNPVNEKELKRALEIAQADFAFDEKDGLDSEVAQRGKNFSGGQKQRLSIARALYKKPSLYLIDDSFSALDFKTERALRAEFKEISKDDIRIIISQRASIIADSDKILVLDRGKIVGYGTHEELKRTSTEYLDILESQDYEVNSYDG